MYGVPISFPISEILGESIEQVCMGENDMVINLSRGKRLLINCPIQMNDMSEPSCKYSENATEVVKLIGSIVSKCVLHPNILEIILDNTWIKIIDDSENYESFVFEFAGGRVVV